MLHWEFLRRSFVRSGVVVVGVLLAAAPAVSATRHARSAAMLPNPDNNYTQTNLVSDIEGVAQATDPHLLNPWGMSSSATSFIWTSNNADGTASLFNGAGVAQTLVVTIPPPAGGMSPAAPTGTVFNGTGQFLVGTGQPGLFLFATEDGTISGWNPNANATEAVLEVDNSASGAVYKGLALGANASGPLLYATNFHSGQVDVFDGTWAPARMAGGFVDWFLPKGYAPFGIMVMPNNNVIVTYALQDSAAHDDVAGVGHGFVDEFDADGNFLRRLISGGVLDSPWGLAIAPSSGFGPFSGALLVGNFGDGRINAFTLPDMSMNSNPDNPFGGFFRFFEGARFMDTLRDSDGHPLTNLGLWGLRFGNGGNGGNPDSLFFTAGIPGSLGTLDVLENHGLFGVITVTPPAPPAP